MRGWGTIIFLGLATLICSIIYGTVSLTKDAIQSNEATLFGVALTVCLLAVLAASLTVPLLYLWISFFSVTDPTVRLDQKRKKAWLWTGKGPIEIAWSRLTPRIESSAASAYATVKTFRGQYAELGAEGEPVKTHGIPHVFQCGQISAAEEGVLPSMEYVRRYMESGPDAVQSPEKFLSHKVHWYAMVNFLGMADDWVRWKENRDRPGIAPAPWARTIVFILFFPLFFPLQFTNWLALAVAPRPKWPKELEAMHAADLEKSRAAEAQRRHANPLLERAQEAERPRRKAVIRVNGELISGGDESSPL